MMPKWLKIVLKLLGILLASIVVFLGLIYFWFSGNFNFLFPHEIATYDSPDGKYTIVFEQLGDASWPFGPADVRLTLRNSQGVFIDQICAKVYNDGGNAYPGNIGSIQWGENEVVVILDSGERPDQGFTFALPNSTGVTIINPSGNSHPAEGHIPNYKVTTTATCGQDGVKTLICSCGYSITQKAAATGQHSWDEWKRKNYAFIDKAGSDERVCTTCSKTETRERTENAVANSFQDSGLQYVVESGGNFNASFMYSYACHEFHNYVSKPNVPAAYVFTLLSKCFPITDEIKNDIKTNNKAIGIDEHGYNATNDTFFLPYYSVQGIFWLVGYKHNGGNRYTTYYSYSDFGSEKEEASYWSFEVEYNRSNGQPNKYLSVKKVASVPNDIIEAEGLREFEGPIPK